MPIVLRGTTIEKVVYNNKTVFGEPELYSTLKNKSTISESEWLQFINGDCIKYIIDNGLQNDWIGTAKTITISNSQTSSYSTWNIADFGHDSSGYTVDLICANNVIAKVFEADNVNNYVNSDIRTWLNDTYYNGFSSSIRKKMDTMVVQTNTSTGLVTTNDKVKLLSAREMNVSTYNDYMPQNEGNPYPIFPSYPWNNSSGSVNKRWRSGAYSNYYWLRSRNTNNTTIVWFVCSSGNLNSYGAVSNSYGVVPVLRFKNKTVADIYNEYKNKTTFTENEWLDFINGDCIKYIIDNNLKSSWIGTTKTITIANTQTSSYSSWNIADFGHDNSGYTVDLIAANNVVNEAFSDANSNNYVYSDIRTWLNGTYYNGFSSNIRSKTDTMSVKTDVSGTLTTTNDKVKLLSCREMNVSSYNSDYMPTNEGNPYPIFPSYPWNNSDNSVNKRWRSGANSSYCWLRSRYTNDTNNVWLVSSNGNLNSTYFVAINSYGVVPVLRFKNI